MRGIITRIHQIDLMTAAAKKRRTRLPGLRLKKSTEKMKKEIGLNSKAVTTCLHQLWGVALSLLASD